MTRLTTNNRRKFLTASTAVVGAMGAFAAGWPLLSSWQPSELARAAGAPITVDISKLEPGQQITVKWRGKPVWILRHSTEMLERLPTVTARLRDPKSQVASQQPAYAANAYRAVRPEFFVVVAVCTHLGCVPSFRPESASEDLGAEWPGGYFCPCHGSRFDLAGRVYSGVPAPTNLLVPAHRYVDDLTA